MAIGRRLLLPIYGRAVWPCLARHVCSAVPPAQREADRKDQARGTVIDAIDAAKMKSGYGEVCP